MQILDIDNAWINDITTDIKEIIITGIILQIRFKDGITTIWKLIE
jgi:Mn2+/Fe2+ NRAMP family transporter